MVLDILKQKLGFYNFEYGIIKTYRKILLEFLACRKRGGAMNRRRKYRRRLLTHKIPEVETYEELSYWKALTLHIRFALRRII